MREAVKATRPSGASRRREARHDARAFGEHCREIYDDTRALAAAVQAATDELERYLTEQVQERPYTTLGIAAGAGFVLGGGFRPRLTAVLLDAATRGVTDLAVSEVAARFSSSLSASGDIATAEPAESRGNSQRRDEE